MPENLSNRKNLKNMRPIFDPMYQYYFDGVQNELKIIITGEPYNISQDEVDNFNDEFFTNGYNNFADIKDTIEEYCVSKKTTADCAKILLDKYFKKFMNNFYTVDKTSDIELQMERNIVLFSTLLKENKMLFDGERAFVILLKILSEFDIKFIKPKDKLYMNTGNYNLFFNTFNITDYTLLIGELKDKESLITTYNAISSNNNIPNLAFYFSVESFVLKYGLYINHEHKLIQTGQFKTTSKFLKTLSMNSTMSIYGILQTINLNNLTFLGKVRTEFKTFLKEKPVYISNNKIIYKKFEYKDFTNPNTPHFQFLTALENWILKYNWNYRVDFYVDTNQKEIVFYIKLKGDIIQDDSRF